jgi:hypothetical protein
MLPLIVARGLARGSAAAKAAWLAPLTTTAAATAQQQHHHHHHHQQLFFSRRRGIATSAVGSAAADDAAAAAAPPRERMEYDLCIVGAGPAGLAAAIRFKQVCAGVSIMARCCWYAFACFLLRAIKGREGCCCRWYAF